MLTFPPDFTFVVQIISFLILWAALKRLTFDPIMQILDDREKRTSGGLAEAEQLRASAAAAQADYEGSLRQARHAVLQQAEVARKEASAEQQRQLEEARAAADAELAQMRSELAVQVKGARNTLSAEARAIAALMAERVTGRSLV